MKPEKNTQGGWVDYVLQWKLKHPDTPIYYKALMQQYIKGEPV